MGRYCVIGKSLPHTLSPKIHSAFSSDFYGVEELCDFEALEAFVKKREYDGYNVTIPYKQEIIPLLDKVSDEAAAIGAVNTVVNENGKLVGYNTDISGMQAALNHAGIALKNKNVMILGSGGTSHTAQYLAKKLGAKSVRVVSRSGDINYNNCYDYQDTEVIINTTPVGMMPNAYASPIDVSMLKNTESVFDCVYNPIKTLIVYKAQIAGLKAANGLFMLVEQARAAHNLFMRAKNGLEVGAESTISVLSDLIAERQNLVFIGMSGSGKTTIGKKAAELLGRKFVDTDEEIEKIEGKSIPEIFKENGEAYFRECEQRVVERVCIRQGLVIATGGGAPMNEKNAFLMGANGIVVFLKADENRLDISNRPLTPNIEKAKALYAERLPKYIAASDCVILNDDKIENVAKNAVEAVRISKFV